jgi:hypothetical protein
MTEDLIRRQREVNVQVLERATTDADFKQLLIDEPDKALRELGVADEIETLEGMINYDPEVVAHCGTDHQACNYFSSRFYCPGYGTHWGPWHSTLR